MSNSTDRTQLVSPSDELQNGSNNKGMIILKKNSVVVLCEMVPLNYIQFGQMRIKLFNGTAVDVKTIPPNKNRFV